MKKILIFLIIILTININYVNAEEFDITSRNVILYNLNDSNILYEKESNQKVPIASLTKIMTTITAIENIDNLDEKVTITSQVFNGIEEYAQAGLKIGDKVTYKDLLYGVMLPSGADAVNALVLNISKNEADFIKLMNDKASKIGLKNTKFDNPIGMDSKDNYSTAQDLATLLIYALKNDTFKTIYTTKKYTIDNLNLTLKSTLLTYGKSLDVSKITGAKSGFTDQAGLCLSSIASIDDVNYLLIVLGSNTSSKANAIKDSLEIYNYYSQNYSYKTIIHKNQVFEKIKVKWGKKKTYDLKSTKDIKLYLKNTISEEDIDYIYKGLTELTYKNKKGQKLGTITAKYHDKTLTTYDVYLNDELSYYHPIIYSIIAFSLILMIISLIQIKKQKKKRNLKEKEKKIIRII